MIAIKRIFEILDQESELRLSFMLGEHAPRFFCPKGKPRFRGFVHGTINYFRLLIGMWRAERQSPEYKQSKIFVFAGTPNQIAALDRLTCELSTMGISTCGVVSRRNIAEYSSSPDKWNVCCFGWRMVIKSAFVFILRRHKLVSALNERMDGLADHRLSSFAIAFLWIAYFDEILGRARPELVLVSNDHNVENRSLLSVAKFRGIKTAYLQHASVSSIFPPLAFDFAFLDGRAALDVYRECEHQAVLVGQEVHRTVVFLTGNTKTPQITPTPGQLIGVAINRLDDTNAVMFLVEALVSAGYTIRLRWHPSTPNSRKDELREFARDLGSTGFSDPREESIVDFAGHIFCLIAGNSSIHLDSALCGVVPIYYEMGVSEIPDYYRYVSKGLSFSANSIRDVLALVNLVQQRRLSVSRDATKYFSETFDTQLEGCEFKLVSRHLKSILDGVEPRLLWGAV